MLSISASVALVCRRVYDRILFKRCLGELFITVHILRLSVNQFNIAEFCSSPAVAAASAASDGQQARIVRENCLKWKKIYLWSPLSEDEGDSHDTICMMLAAAAVNTEELDSSLGFVGLRHYLALKFGVI